MDFGELWRQEHEEALASETEEGQALAARQQQVEQEQAKAVSEEAHRAYQTSEVAKRGPDQQVYDYKSAYESGVDFNGENIPLPNRHIVPAQVEVAGHDLATGEKLRSTWNDRNGYIAAAVKELGESKTVCLQDGTCVGPHDDIPALAGIAAGIQSDAGSFDDFRGAVPETWSEDQLQVAWTAAENGRRRKEFERRVAENDFEGVPQDPTPVYPEPFDPDTLHEYQPWLNAARQLYFLQAGDEAPEDPQELSDWALDQMAKFNWDVSAMGMMALRAHEDPELAKALYVLSDIYDNTGTNWGVAGRSLYHAVTDPTTYAGLGAGGIAAKGAVRFMLKEAMKTTGKIGAIEGGMYSAADESLRQSIGMSAGAEQYDPAAVAGAGALGAGMGFVLGTVGQMGFAQIGKWGEEAWKRLKSMEPGPTSGSMAAQRGHLGVKEQLRPVSKDNKIRAYHGSPHDFDKFMLEHIGAGEGAQAYGHGLYFAESEDVARGYRDQLTDKDTIRIGAIDDTFFDDFDVPVSDIRSQVAKMYAQEANNPGFLKDVADDSTFVGRIASAINRGDITRAKGSMYEVNINATVDEFLQWDDILDEQPERVMQMLQSTDWWEFADEGAWNRAGARGENAIGGDLVRWLEDDGPEFAAEQLRKAGIKGIRYKDGFSRGKDGVATYNYVVFDENIIEIAKKYGISVMAAGYLSALYMQKGGQNDDNET